MREKDYQGELALSRQIIATQREQIVNLEAKVISLEAKVLILLKLQESQSIKKDSHNSSLPPSSDLYRVKTKSLRPTAYVKTDQYKKAVDLLHLTIKQHPYVFEYINLAGYYLQEGNLNKAVATLIEPLPNSIFWVA